MDRELDERLVSEHPILFGDRYGSMRVTAMCWGFDVGNGWYDLLKEAADKLEPLCHEWNEKYKNLEKPWYKPIRNIIARTAEFRTLWMILYHTTQFLNPDIFNSPIYYYGGPPRAAQVKEKFGTLRFYMTHSSDEMEAIIDEAERKSAITCEACGKPGKVVGGGWLYCRCRECFDKLLAEGYTLGNYDEREEIDDDLRQFGDNVDSVGGHAGGVADLEVPPGEAADEDQTGC